MHEQLLLNELLSTQILHKVDTILFSVLILRGLIDSHGHVWRCHPAEMYIVEATVQAEKVNVNDYLHVCVF